LAAPDWTAQERQWVDNLRDLYRKQDMDLTQDQANAAVKAFREKAQTGQRGIPSSEWTPREASMVAQYRIAYQKQGLPFSDEQAALAVQSMRDQIARLTGSIAVAQALSSHNISVLPVEMPALRADAPPATSTAVTVSESQLAAQFAALPAKACDLQVRQRREGFTVNGQPVVDAEGPITMYAFDVVSGDVTFAVQAPRNLEIKFMRAGAAVPPRLIAIATRSGAGWSVQTVSGLSLSGSTLSMLPRGLLVARPGAAFRYDPGQGVKNIAVPEGFVLASIQRGNIGGTGYVLLERDTPPVDPQGGLFASVKAIGGSVKAIGANLGVNSKADYALYNAETGQTFPLNIDSDGKEVTTLSDCYRRSGIVNRCNSAETFESLYDELGRRNIHHYYWRAQWLNTPHGPIAITLEGGNRDAYITDLVTGKKVVAFHRALGIADMEVTQNPDGTVSIDAQLAFQHQSVPDAVAFLAQASAATVVASTMGATP
jgi:hypothetical protein